MRRNALVFIALVVAIMAMLASGKYLDRARKHGPIKLLGNVQGVRAPDFTLTSLDGSTVRLSDFRGKAVLLNFWATWCAPCKIEMPWFVDLQKQYASQGLQVIGVAMDDSGEDAIAKFTKQMGINYPILIGKEAVGDAYGGVEFLPTTFIIDRQGKVVDRVFGLVSRSEFEDGIKKALGGATPAAQASAKEPAQ